MDFKLRVVLAGAALACAATANATLVFSNVVNNGANGSFTGTPLAARDALRNQLSNVGTETFEGFAVGDPGNGGFDGNGDPIPLNINFVGRSPSMGGAIALGNSNSIMGVQVTAPDPNQALGRFNTTTGGSKFLEWQGTFTLNFDVAISAFGVFATDINDFGGSIAMCVYDAAGLNPVCDTTPAGSDGNLAFLGFVDTDGATHSKVTFTQTLLRNVPDAIGFDDMFVGDVGPGTPQLPEPASLVLAGLGMLGVAAARRRRSLQR